MNKNKNTYIIKKYPNNKTGVSRSRVYDENHFISFLKEMEIGEEVILKNNKGEYKIKKISEVNKNEPKRNKGNCWDN